MRPRVAGGESTPYGATSHNLRGDVNSADIAIRLPADVLWDGGYSPAGEVMASCSPWCSHTVSHLTRSNLP